MKNIELLSASAGSGKTYRLTEELHKALQQGLAPSDVLATTFTVKAARELQERVREKLLKVGFLDKAQLLEGACMGTVHSVCSQLLSLFCFEAGISPSREIMPEKLAAGILRKALSQVVEEYQPRIHPLAERLQVEDWLEPVSQIVDLARSNGIPPQKLSQHAERSWQSFSALLPEAMSEEEGRKLEAELREELNKTIAVIKSNGDTTATTKKVLVVLEQFQRKLESGRVLAWGEWVKLSKCAPAKISQQACAGLTELAAQHAQLPSFQDDVREFMALIFSCAGKAMQAFAEYKTEHGLQDYNDLEALALQVLQDPANLEQVGERFGLLLVDEFQDTSPLQLAIFLQLAQTVKRSIWVGDQKQAIFGFRGTDPQLMDAVVQTLGEPDRLERSWRSRRELVEFVNALFTPIFEKQGIPRERVVLQAQRKESLETPPLLFWKLDCKNITQDAEAVAVGIANLLRRDPPLQVFDKASEAIREVRPCDILVLCRKNDNARNIATALEQCGVGATVARIGLLQEPEAVAALAGYRLLLDKSDSLAAAELVHLLRLDDESHGWLQKAMQTPEYGFWKQYPLLQSFEENRQEVSELTPAECLERAIELLDLEHAVLGWGAAGRRRANLEALRSLVLQYEELCRVERRVPTPGGLLPFLEGVAKDKADEQAVFQEEDSVRVMTYHKAKGLEAPVAVLTDLNSGIRNRPFGLSVDPAEDFSLDAPLAGRSIRYWPWPYGRQQKDYGYEAAVAESPEQASSMEREAREAARLLYVGMTRARDCLILAVGNKPKSSETVWLTSVLEGHGGISFGEETGGGVRFSTPAGDFPFVTETLSPDLPERPAGSRQFYEPVPGERIGHPRATFTPSSVVAEGVPKPRILDLGPRPELRGSEDMNSLGSALHAFLAADQWGASVSSRLEMATSLVRRWGITGISPDSFVEMSDRLLRAIHDHFASDCQIMREWPMALRQGLQRASGQIDMLVRGPNGLLIIDHKSFPGSMEKALEKAKGAYGQLDIYKVAVEKATEEQVVSMWMHLPLAGNIYCW